jgi:hypothetical protein
MAARDCIRRAREAGVAWPLAEELTDAALERARLLERFPYAHDGWDRLGMVYEARGENREAVIARSSPSCATTPTTTIPPSRTNSSSSSPNSTRHPRLINAGTKFTIQQGPAITTITY